MSNSIFSGNPSLAAFLIRLAELKSPFSRSINISKNQLAKQLNVGKSTLYKYLNLAQKNSSISIQGDEIILSPNLFPTFEKSIHPTKEQTLRLKEIANTPDSVEAKILSGYYNRQTNTVTG